jgi:hypothetical protein
MSGSHQWPDLGWGNQRPIPPDAIGVEESLMVATVTTKSVESPVCPGSGTFPDVVNDVILDELTYACATCGASVPNFEVSPVHRHGLGGPAF